MRFRRNSAPVPVSAGAVSADKKAAEAASLISEAGQTAIARIPLPSPPVCECTIVGSGILHECTFIKVLHASGLRQSSAMAGVKARAKEDH